MRTTLTIEPDVAARLECLRKRRGGSLKAIINAVLREGLTAIDRPSRPRKRFRTKSVDAGKCLLPNVDNIAEVLAIAEGEDYK